MIFFTQKKWFGVTFLLAVIALGLSFFVSKLPLRNTEVPLPHDQDVVSSVPVVHDTLHIFKLPS